MYSLKKLQDSMKKNQEGKLELNLSSQNLSIVPEAISQLTELQVLDLSNNRRITQLPAELNRLENLTCLHLSGCVSLKAFPASQCFPIQLEELRLDGCGLTEIGTAITDLNGLEKLDLSRNPIESIPSTINRLVALKELTLRRCKLTELKNEITELTGLEKLDLSWNRIKSIPSTISRLVALKELALSGCGLTEVKNEITELAGLENLHLSWNHISSIPSTIIRLLALKELVLLGCELTELKSEITELVGLEKLCLSKNPVRIISKAVDKLSSLIELDLKGCELQRVPESLFDMKSLKTLMLQNNQLRELPLGILNLKGWLNYREIDLSGNPLVLPPSSVSSQGIEAMFNFLLEYREQSTVHLRLVLVGSSRAGKTSLVKTLVSGMSTLVEEDDRTVVLERSNWEACSKECSVNIQVVDFGGQEWYRVIHPFFLDKDALVLLAINLGTYSRENFGKYVGSWLHVLESRAPKATVFLVLTQADQIDKKDVPSKIEEIKQLALQSECGVELQHVKIASSKTMENIKELEEEIIQFAVVKGRKIPSSWLFLYREMCLADDVKQKQFLIMEEVKRMFKRSTKRSVVQRMLKTTEQRCHDVLSFLHSIGIITWYEHPAELSKYVFHHPEYLAEMLKVIFADHRSTGYLSYKHAAFNAKFSSVSFEKEKECLLQQGVMSRDLLKGLWEHMKLDEELFNGMMQLLVQFDLCFVLSYTSDGYVDNLRFPWFLKDDAGPEVLQVLHSVPLPGYYRLTLEYRFLALCPPPLYEKLAVRMNHHIQDVYSRNDWKNGVLASIFNSQVLVQRVTDGGNPVISIAVEGEDLVELWEVLLSLKEDMTSLLREWPGVRFERWFLCPHCVQLSVKQPGRFPGDYVERMIPWRQLWITCPEGTFKIPACLVYPIKGSKQNVQRHLELLPQFTFNMEKHCVPCEQNSDGPSIQSANVSLPDEEVDSSSVPTLKILKELSKEIIPRWQFLGLQLDVSQATIDNIIYNNVLFVTPEQKAFQMLKSWWDMGSSSTFGKLAGALRREGLGRLADKYCRGM